MLLLLAAVQTVAVAPGRMAPAVQRPMEQCWYDLGPGQDLIISCYLRYLRQAIEIGPLGWWVVGCLLHTCGHDWAPKSLQAGHLRDAMPDQSDFLGGSCLVVPGPTSKRASLLALSQGSNGFVTGFLLGGRSDAQVSEQM